MSPARIRSDIRAELDTHIESEVERLIEEGWSAGDARAAVLSRFGDPDSVRAECEGIAMDALRRERRTERMEAFLRDVRYALRGFARNPLFTAVAVLTLALGIAATTAVFTVVDVVLLRPLPYLEPERLVTVWEQNRRQEILADNPSPPNLLDWQRGQSTFEELGAWADASVTLTGGDRPDVLSAIAVTSNFFRMLGVAPAEGRDLRVEDEDAGGVVVLSHGARERFFGNGPAVGRTLQFEDSPYEVVAVMPESFGAPRSDTDVWLPSRLANDREHRQTRYLFVMGRMAPGVTIEQAEADLDGIASRLAELYPESNTDWEVSLVSARDQVVGDAGRTLLMVLAAVGFVLLIACVNVANLLLGRAISRGRELAVRTALGAGHGRIVAQLLTESLVLGAAGAVLGVVLAKQAVGLFLRLEPGAVPRLDEVTLDTRVLVFTMAVSVVTAVLCGLAPALRAAKDDGGAALSDRSSRGTASGRGAERLRKLLVVGEVAVSLVLLIAAGLFLRSFFELRRVDPGFDQESVLAAKIALNNSRYPRSADRVQYFEQLEDALTRVPGVQSVGVTSTLPMDPTGTDFDLAYHAEGWPAVTEAEANQIDYRVISTEYLRAMGIDLVEGRAFNRFDRADGVPVLLVNESFARTHWPQESAVGKRVKIFYVEDTEWEVVGVVADTRHQGLAQPARAQMFVPVAQAQYLFGYMTVVVRHTPGLDVSDQVRNAALSLDPNEPLYGLQPVTTLLRESVSRDRFVTVAFGIFGLLALVLSSAGIYGVISYQVLRRTHEIGVRMALGARTRTVLGHVLADALKLSVAGVGIGLVGAWFATRVLRFLLYEVGPTDPWVFGGVPLVLVSVAVLAALIPARRAAGIDPVRAMRAE